MTDCSIVPCDRPATVRVERSALGTRRVFCEACYQAWKRGAGTMFTNGVPRGKPLVRD